MMTHPLPITSKLPVKKLVAKQLPTHTHMHTHTHTCTYTFAHTHTHTQWHMHTCTHTYTLNEQSRALPAYLVLDCYSQIHEQGVGRPEASISHSRWSDQSDL